MNEYKRLTKKDKYGHWYTDTKINDRFMWSINGKIWERDLTHCAFDGEAIDRLAELEDKIENSKLVELPCNVGDIVYFPTDDGWNYAEIDQIYILNNDIIFEWVQYDKSYEITELWDDGEFSIHDIGKTEFLTREEAEAKFKELTNGSIIAAITPTTSICNEVK